MHALVLQESPERLLYEFRRLDVIEHDVLLGDGVDHVVILVDTGSLLPATGQLGARKRTDRTGVSQGGGSESPAPLFVCCYQCRQGALSRDTGSILPDIELAFRRRGGGLARGTANPHCDPISVYCYLHSRGAK